MVSIKEKIRIFVKATKIFKNWNDLLSVYFKLTKKETIIFKTKNNIKLKIRVNSTDFMALTNVWIIEEYAKEGFHIKNDDIVIDIGGHIGLFSIYAAEKCKSGKIFSFEPVKENFEMLKDNIAVNKIKNIFPENVAISNEKSKVTIFLSNDESGHGMYSKSSNSITIDAINLEEIYLKNNLKKCDFLKIDAEGAEFDILENISENMLKTISKIVIEYHIFNRNLTERLENIVEKFEKNGFKITKTPYSDTLGLLFLSNENHRS